MCTIIYVSENESMQTEIIGEDGHTSQAEDDKEITDCTQSTQAFSSPTTMSSPQ